MAPSKKGGKKPAAKSGIVLSLKNYEAMRSRNQVNTNSGEASSSHSSAIPNPSNSSATSAATPGSAASIDSELASTTPVSSDLVATTPQNNTSSTVPANLANDVSDNNTPSVPFVLTNASADNTAAAVSTTSSRTSSTSSLASRRGFNYTIDVGGPPVYPEDAVLADYSIPQPPSPSTGRTGFRWSEPSTPQPESAGDPIIPTKMVWDPDGVPVNPDPKPVKGRFVFPDVSASDRQPIDLNAFLGGLPVVPPISVFQVYTDAPNPAAPLTTVFSTVFAPAAGPSTAQASNGLQLTGVASTAAAGPTYAPLSVSTQGPNNAALYNSALTTAIPVAGRSTVAVAASTTTRVGTTAIPPNDAALATPWHCGNRDCQSGQTWMLRKDTGRKVISEFFGKNKKATHLIPEEVWHYYCRIDYQRESYRAEGTKEFQLAQLEKVRAQFARIGLWRPNAKFCIQLKEAMNVRLAHYQTIMARNGGDHDAALIELDGANVVKQHKKTQKTMLSSVQACPFDVADQFESELDQTNASIAKCLEVVTYMEKVINDKSLLKPLPIEFLLLDQQPGEVVNDPASNYQQWIAQEDALAVATAATTRTITAASAVPPQAATTAAPRAASSNVRRNRTQRGKATVKKEEVDTDTTAGIPAVAELDRDGDSTMINMSAKNMDVQAVKGLLLLTGQYRDLTTEKIQKALAIQSIAAMTRDNGVADYEYTAAVHIAAAQEIAGLLGRTTPDTTVPNRENSAAVAPAVAGVKRKRSASSSPAAPSPKRKCSTMSPYCTPTTPETSPPPAPSRLALLADVATASPSTPTARRA